MAIANALQLEAARRRECLTTLLLKVFTQGNFAADYLRQKYTFRGKMVNLHFWAPFGGLVATYAVHLRLIGKLVVDFLSAC